MTSTSWTVLVLGVLVLLLMAWLGFTLTRLRRLGGRVDRAWDVLDAALTRRTELADALVRESRHELGPGLTDAVAGAVADSRRPVGGDREVAENALGRVLREVPDRLRGPQLDDAGWRVGLARRFYNDAVRDTRALRRRPLVRVLRVHARHALPRFFDIDDGLDVVVGSASPGGAG